MADQQLLQYIIAQERAGYTEQQIRQALGSNGYQQSAIDEAFASLGGKTVVDDVVHDNAQQYARQGYSALQTFSQLTTQGFSPKTVRKAVNEVYGPGAAPAQHHTGKVVFALVAVVVAVVGVYFLTGFSKSTVETPPIPVTGNPVVLSVPEQIYKVQQIARESGKEAAVHECEARFQGDDRDLCYLDIAITDKVLDDKICDKISDVKMRDTCLMNFLETDRFASVCARIQLAANKDTCNQLAAFSNTKTTAT